MPIVVKTHIPAFEGDMPKDWKPHMPTRCKGNTYRTFGQLREDGWTFVASSIDSRLIIAATKIETLKPTTAKDKNV